jgi:leader peptidase (prepilin peptidase)/N-methyltransferase
MIGPDLAALPRGIWLVFIFGLGAAVGSFLNVVIHRLPRRESLVRPGSRCVSCGSAVPAWANLPILGYLILRGKCVSCRAAISARYPLVEALTAVLFLSLFLKWELPLVLVYWPLAAALVAVAFIDLEHQIIPNGITLPGIPIGLACAWLFPWTPSLLDAMLGALVVGGMMWAVAAIYERFTGRVGLGLGDVKLMAMLGAFLGLETTLGILVIGCLLGLVQGLLLMGLKRAGRFTRIPFGPALAVAGILHLFDPHLFPRALGLT